MKSSSIKAPMVLAASIISMEDYTLLKAIKFKIISTAINQ